MPASLYFGPCLIFTGTILCIVALAVGDRWSACRCRRRWARPLTLAARVIREDTRARRN